jgi:thioredoxin 1
MNSPALDKIIKTPGKSVVLEFWAPWCGPCRSMTPILKQTEDDFKDRVNLVRINVDENQELARSMKVIAIPSMIAYKDGKELFRKTGAQSGDSMRSFFSDAADGVTSRQKEISPISRVIRFMAGMIVLGSGIQYNFNWILILAGGLLAFWAFYDRCPIFTALSSWFKSKSASQG